MFIIFCTKVLGLGVNFLVNVAVAMSCNSIVLQVTNCWNITDWQKWRYGGNTKKHQGLLIYPRVTRNMPTKLRKEHCLQQTWLQYATAKIKIAWFSIKMRASQPDGQWAWMLTIFRTWVLGLGVNILVNVACNSVVLAPGHKLMKTSLIGEKDAMPKIFIITRNY